MTRIKVHPAEACASLPVRRKIYVRQELRRQGAAGRKGSTGKEGMVGGRLGFSFLSSRCGCRLRWVAEVAGGSGSLCGG